MPPGETTNSMLPEDVTTHFSVSDIEFARKKETIAQNAMAQKQAELVAEKLASMRADRAASITERDRDENGRVRNGLFGWRILKRSILTSQENRRQARSDRQEAEEYAKQESGMYEKFVETTLERAANDWGDVSNATCKKELSELMELVNERYELDQEEPASMSLGGKLRQVLLSNSRLLNMGIGAGFRIAFKTATHLTGLGGAVLASGIYGGVSTGLREYGRIKKEKLGMKGWREELDRIDSTDEKLALMRQIAKKENFRKYFAGNSSEAFEFLNIFYHLSAQADQKTLSDIASPNLLKEIYRRKGIGQGALIQAGKGAFRAMAYSAIGYEIANAFSGLIHANGAVENEPPGTRVSDAPQGATPSHDLAPGTHEGALDPNAPPGAHEFPAPQGATHLPPETGAHSADAPPVEQNAPDTPEAPHNSVEWRPQGRLTITNHQFETGQGHDAVVKIEENAAIGDAPGASPEEVAHEIARNIGRGPSGQSLEISAAQQQQIEDHIATWLHQNQSGNLHEGLYPTGEEVHVPADELNVALKGANVDTTHIGVVPETTPSHNEAPAAPVQTPDAHHAPAAPQATENFPDVPKTATDADVTFVSGENAPTFETDDTVLVQTEAPQSASGFTAQSATNIHIPLEPQGGHAEPTGQPASIPPLGSERSWLNETDDLKEPSPWVGDAAAGLMAAFLLASSIKWSREKMKNAFSQMGELTKAGKKEAAEKAKEWFSSTKYGQKMTEQMAERAREQEEAFRKISEEVEQAHAPRRQEMEILKLCTFSDAPDALTPDGVYKLGLGPKKQIKLDGFEKRIFISEKSFEYKGNTIGLAYIETPNGKFEAIAYIQDATDGMLHFYDKKVSGERRDEKAGEEKHSGDYERLILPAKFQEAIIGQSVNTVTFPDKTAGAILNTFSDFSYTRTERWTNPTGKTINSTAGSIEDYPDEPHTINIINPQNRPKDFSKSKIVAHWETSNGFYGKVYLECFESENGEYLYTFCHTADNKAWIGNIEMKKIPIGDYTLRRDWVDGGLLTTPPLIKRVKLEGKPNGQYIGEYQGKYADISEKFVGKIPLVAEYIKELETRTA